MKNYTLLIDPQPVIGRQWRQDQPPERARILGLARDALLFLSATGQQSRFEDFVRVSSPLLHGAPSAFQEDFELAR